VDLPEPAILQIKMENKLLLAVLAMLAALIVGSSAIPLGDKDAEVEADERATWLDTRDIEEEFKELVYLAVQELVNEGRIADITEQKESSKDKRGRWQGFCFRRTRSGRFLPYICWKGGNARK